MIPHLADIKVVEQTGPDGVKRQKRTRASD
ncbi:MAG: hypothetical protein RLZZ50_1718 [Verrucomicrobiota bacterium]|jgi:hypothetical protein